MLLLATISAILAIKLSIIGAMFLVITLIPGVLLFCNSYEKDKKINFKEKKPLLVLYF